MNAQIIARLDAILAEVIAIRQSVASDHLPEAECDGALPPDELYDTATLAERFNVPADTIRKACRDKGLGQKTGGAWLVSLSDFKRHFRHR